MSLLSSRSTGTPIRASAGTPSLRRTTFYFLAVVVAVQGTHVVEHIVQLGQVFIWNVPEDDALGLLGYVVQFYGTEEWLHLGYNALYLTALYALFRPLRRITPTVIPPWSFAAFVASAAVETWHMVEHAVIISHVIANHGCPCPGIGDAALGVSDVVLHFVYNLMAYGGVLAAFLIVWRRRPGRAVRRPGPSLSIARQSDAGMTRRNR